MPVSGSQLDRFEILELLGAGGMGEVYRAHDTRLRRNVALKLLPENFLRDPERRARFEREAQVLGSLNHPNIAALHEIVTVPGSQVLVMELVEGETLAECIAEGPLPVPEALGIAAQIAAALEAAHEQGIVHRDLKSGNVKLRPDGTVKLLDFGLAKISDQALRDMAAEDVTLTVGIRGAATDQILGSPSCMSPEQARGLPVDKRTDVWAFGCLLYEMLCGKRAFAGECASDVIAKILEREPDFTLLPAGLPAPVTRTLRRCLEKDRRRRQRDMGDVRIELLDALDHPATEPTATGAFTARASVFHPIAHRHWVLAAVVATLLAGAAAWFALRPGEAAASRQVARFAISEPSLGGSGVAISADGSKVAYVTGRGLMVRSLNRLDSTIAVATNGVQGRPFFSSDGHWLGFKGWDALRKVPATGGAATTLVDRVFPAGAWNGDHIIYGETRGLYQVPAAGGNPVELLATGAVEQIVSVEMLADRQSVLFTVIPTRGNVPGMAANMPAARIEALDLRTGAHHVVLRGGGRPRYVRTGHLLYASGGTLFAIGFDTDRLQTRGKAFPVVETSGLIDFDVSNEGTLFYQVVPPAEERQLVWVDRSGRETSLGAPIRPYVYARLSPDSSRVAVDMTEDGVDRNGWIWDVRRATLALFTKDPAHNPLIVWSPDGRQLVFGSERSGVSNLYRQAIDGSGDPEHLLASDSLQMPISYTPDGRLLVSVGVTGQQRDIHLLSLDGERRIIPLIQGPANELTAEVSPDGRWIAYDSDESGQFEVYVRAFPESSGGSRWQVSSGGGRQPLWSRDGSELFYRDFSGAVMSVPLAPGPGFAPGRSARVLEGANYAGGGAQGGGRTYDVSADGRRFLMLRGSGTRAAPELVVVLNWFDELRRLAPSD